MANYDVIGALTIPTSRKDHNPLFEGANTMAWSSIVRLYKARAVSSLCGASPKIFNLANCWAERPGSVHNSP